MPSMPVRRSFFPILISNSDSVSGLVRCIYHSCALYHRKFLHYYYSAPHEPLTTFQPILQQATGVLGEGSKSVIESGDQFEVRDPLMHIFIIVNDILQVFDNPNASDPTHSVLSKVCQVILYCTSD